MRESGHLEDIAGHILHQRGGHLHVISGYLRASIGVGGVNVRRLQCLAGFLKSLSDPWVVYMDWTLTPEELQSSGWVAQVGGTVRTAQGL